MSKPLSKKALERRRKARSRQEGTEKARRKPRVEPANDEVCHQCSKDLRNEERALFVEEEVGRVFCSEDCITQYFSPEIEKLEKEYLKHLSKGDLTPDEREQFAHLRWITLEEPDEIWREKTLAGDFHYTLISEFKPGNRTVWCVCICLFLRGEPSFLYLAFPTRNAALVNHYRRGERVEWNRGKEEGGRKGKAEPHGHAHGTRALAGGKTAGEGNPERTQMDGLAEAWTEDETLRAQLTQRRRADDVPHDEFELYQGCLDETLQGPDEVWSFTMGEGEDETKLYHFIKYYGDDNPAVWYVIVARETKEDEEQIEILDAFPTRDSDLVDRYRRGEQEVGAHEAAPSSSRLVH
jgi:hypothetical protein